MQGRFAQLLPPIEPEQDIRELAKAMLEAKTGGTKKLQRQSLDNAAYQG